MGSRVRTWFPPLMMSALLLSPSDAGAQGGRADAGGAQAVAEAFLKAVAAADWKAAAGMLDLAPLERQRQSSIENARRQRAAPPMTVGWLMRSDSNMPRAVAEYQLERMRQTERPAMYLEHDFGVTDPDSLMAMPIEHVAERWLEVHDSRWMTRRALRGSRCASLVGTDSILPAPVHHVLGSVVTDSIAFVLYETDERPSFRLESVVGPAPLMLILHRAQNTWWVVPRYNMSGTFGVAVDCSTKARPSEREPRR